jgi:hypothetical protein
MGTRPCFAYSKGSCAMADQDSRPQHRGTVAANGSRAAATRAAPNGRRSGGMSSKRDSDAIVAEIERTRQSLARTIDALTDRVSPAANARRIRETVSEQLSKPQVRLAILAAGIVVTGLVVYRAWGRRRG